jgi:hypothetical protein
VSIRLRRVATQNYSERSINTSYECLEQLKYESVSAMMAILDETLLDRAQAKYERLERELKKSPDFQLYLLTESRSDRARMEYLLMQIPEFRIWRTLTSSIELARQLFAVLTPVAHISKEASAGLYARQRLGSPRRERAGS